MTRQACRRIEPLLALAAGGDLSPASAAAAAVEEHLSTCGSCRRAADGLTDTVHRIRELPALRLSPEESLALRRGVWSRIEQIRAADRPTDLASRGIGWKTAVWAAAALVLLLLLLPWRAAREEAPAIGPVPSLARTAPGARDLAPPAAAATRPTPESAAPRVARRSARRHFRPAPESNEPVRIELSTPNPNVRIVWLVGSAGEDLPPWTDDFATVTSPTTIKEDPE
jgi:hypothetical protein